MSRIINTTMNLGIVIDKNGNFIKSNRFPECKTIEEYIKKVATSNNLTGDTVYKLLELEVVERMESNQFLNNCA